MIKSFGDDASLFLCLSAVGVDLSIADEIKLGEIYFNEMILQNTQTVYKLIWEKTKKWYKSEKSY